MNRRVLVTTFLSMLLAGPVLGQQTNSSSGGQSTSSTDQTLEPLPAPARTNFWDGDDPNVVNLITHPFANKKYVQRMTLPIRDRLNELDELTASDARSIKDIDGRAQQGIHLASEKTTLADNHATEAAAGAQTAQTAANQASTRVSTLERQVVGLDQYNAGAQTEIRFRPGQTLLSKQAKDALDEMAAPLKSRHNYIVEVHGYSPGQGQAAIAASQKMADAVVRYLVLNHEIPVYRIYEVGMGNAPATGQASAKRATARVEVNVLNNDLVSSAQQ